MNEPTIQQNSDTTISQSRQEQRNEELKVNELREKKNEYARQWRKNNPEKCELNRKRYYENHKEELYQKQLEYRRKNPDKVRQWNMNYDKKRNERREKFNAMHTYPYC